MVPVLEQSDEDDVGFASRYPRSQLVHSRTFVEAHVSGADVDIFDDVDKLVVPGARERDDRLTLTLD